MMTDLAPKAHLLLTLSAQCWPCLCVGLSLWFDVESTSCTFADVLPQAELPG
jgi:hypothetical protein